MAVVTRRRFFGRRKAAIPEHAKCRACGVKYGQGRTKLCRGCQHDIGQTQTMEAQRAQAKAERDERIERLRKLDAPRPRREIIIDGVVYEVVNS